jgi:dolichol-phosphate mannosyltransferase
MKYLLLPAYNEAANIIGVIEEARAVFTERKENFMVVAVDDGSTDSTFDLLKEYAKNIPLKIIHFEKNQGVDAVFRAGIEWACAQAHEEDILISMDCDRTHPAETFHRLIDAVREGNDIVIASRYHPESSTVRLPLKRLLLSNGINMLLQVFFPLPGAKDYTTFFRAYRLKTLKKGLAIFGDTFIESRGFPCMAEILIKLRAVSPRVVEVPLALRFDRRTGKSKMKVWNTVLGYLKLLFLFRKKLNLDVFQKQGT